MVIALDGTSPLALLCVLFPAFCFYVLLSASVSCFLFAAFHPLLHALKPSTRNLYYLPDPLLLRASPTSESKRSGTEVGIAKISEHAPLWEEILVLPPNIASRTVTASHVLTSTLARQLQHLGQRIGYKVPLTSRRSDEDTGMSETIRNRECDTLRNVHIWDGKELIVRHERSALPGEDAHSVIRATTTFSTTSLQYMASTLSPV